MTKNVFTYSKKLLVFIAVFLECVLYHCNVGRVHVCISKEHEQTHAVVI